MLPYTTYHIPETESNQTEKSIKWLWMIVREPLTEVNTELLLKISAALKADFTADVRCILMHPDEPISLTSEHGSKPKLVISFGVNPAEIGLWIDLGKPGMRTMESFTFVLTLPVDELANHAGAKKELWGYMQIYLEH